MDAVKPMLASKGLWGAFFAAAAPLLTLLGITLSTEDITFLTNTVIGLITTISMLVSIIGGIIAFVGRKNANTRVGGFATADPMKAPPRSIL